MINQDQVKDLQSRAEALGGYLKIAQKREEVASREQQALAPGFWDDPKEAESFMRQTSSVKTWITAYDGIISKIEDLEVLLELDPEGQDTEDAYADALKALEDLEFKNMLGAEGDNLGAVLTINSGAGGTEANDWSAMLMRMYVRWGHNSLWVVKHNLVVNVSVKWKYGHCKHMVLLTPCRKCSPLNQMTFPAERRFTKPLSEVKTPSTLVFLNPLTFWSKKSNLCA